MAHGSSELGWPKPALLYERSPGEASAPLGENAVYRQHHPDKSVLYKVVQEQLESALAEARLRTQHGFGYPRFVEQTLRDYLACSRAEFGPRGEDEHSPNREARRARGAKRRQLGPTIV